MAEPHGVYYNGALERTEVWWEGEVVFWAADEVPPAPRAYGLRQFLVRFLGEKTPDVRMVAFLTNRKNYAPAYGDPLPAGRDVDLGDGWSSRP